jgi:hypothetical protein
MGLYVAGGRKTGGFARLKCMASCSGVFFKPFGLNYSPASSSLFRRTGANLQLAHIHYRILDFDSFSRQPKRLFLLMDDFLEKPPGRGITWELVAGDLRREPEAV